MQAFLKVLAVTALLASDTFGFESIVRPENPMMDKAMKEHGDGFGWANHEVHTEDGYILNVFRLLPPGVNRAAECHDCFAGEPVFLMHGLGSNAISWIKSENRDVDPLPIALAKSGYDVWLGNNRGNSVSSRHEQLDWDADEAEYWDYSFPEMAMNDLPAMLQTVFEETGEKKINYIGYSLGTTQMFYALSDAEMQMQLSKQLKQVVDLAPILVP